jgi:hypothetical protein
MRLRPLLLVAGPAIALGGALVTVSTSGCGDCSGTYNCPFGETLIPLPANVSSPVASVTATAPCTYDSFQAGSSRSIAIRIDGEQTGSCTVDVTLADGSRLWASFSFGPLKCCGGSVADDPVTLSPVGP